MPDATSGTGGGSAGHTGSVRQSEISGVAVAVTGTVGGDVTVQVGRPAVHSAYLEQVRRIAPERLVDRDGDLAELADFCTGPDHGPYMWWQAPAWAGKSALMSWFVLHPPAGVTVVSFFITGRYAGQSDRTAFVDVVLEQLAGLLRQPMPAYLTEATRDAHLLAMFGEAAVACERQGRRLVLAVDGLDEDRGVTVGPDAHSIAALLPARPPAGMRIIVAGRPDPPIPSDVVEEHPLRRAAGVVRRLDLSPHAHVIKVDAHRELKRLLYGTPMEQEILGLLTAAGGGLSNRDLAELTGSPQWQIEEHLHAVSGRTFARRLSAWQPGIAPEVYVLGHEELQVAASHFLGEARLAGHRQQLHAWAERYRQRGWPVETPEYLLRGYHGMLRATGDLAGMLACAGDQGRHDRMLDVTGGDTAALTEITDAQDVLLGHDEPDLRAMARLSMRRSALAERNAHIPTDLPAVWAAAGHPARGEALAYAIGDAYQQALALTALVRAAAGAGDLTRVRMLADQAQAAAGTISDMYFRDRPLTGLVEAVAGAGDHERAETVISAIDHHEQRAEGLTALARALAVTGDATRAAALLAPISHTGWRAQALTAVAKVLAAAGHHDRAEALAEQAVTVTARITYPSEHARALIGLVEVVTAVDPDRTPALIERTEAVARRLHDDDRARVLADLASAMAAAGHEDRARALAGQAERAAVAVTDPLSRAMALIGLMDVVARIDPGRAMTPAEHAEAAVRLIGRPDVREQAFIALVQAVAAAGHRDRAAAMAGTIAEPYQRGRALTVLVEAEVAAGDHDRAEATAHAIADPHQRAQALTALAKGLAEAGDEDRARTRAAQAEAVARLATDAGRQAEVLTRLAEAVAAAGDPDRARAVAYRAERVAGTIREPRRRAPALTAVVPVLAATGDHRRVRAVAQQAEAAALLITAGWTPDSEDADTFPDLEWQAEALATLSEVVADTGDHAWAEAIAGAATGWRQGRALITLVKTVAATGDIDRAEGVARAITDPDQLVQALTGLVKAAAGAGALDRARAFAGRATTLVREHTAAIAGSAHHDDYGALLNTKALTALAETMDAIGDRDEARTLAEEAVTTAATIANETWRAELLAALANLAATTGCFARVEALAHAITDPHPQAHALAALAHAAAGAGDLGRAQGLTAQAETAARNTTYVDDQASAMTAVAKVLAAIGDHERADALARSIINPDAQGAALTALAKVADPATARRMIARALRVSHWTTPLDALARVEPVTLMTIADEVLDEHRRRERDRDQSR